MHSLDALNFSGRRNVSRLVETLTTITPGTTATAAFRSDLYGRHLVCGTVVVSGATGGYLLGGQPLDTNGQSRRPVADLFSLEASVKPLTPHTEPDVAGLSHGDIVTAVFDQAPYGLFGITGFAIHAPVAGVFAVGGGWYLTDRTGSPAARLIGIERTAGAGAHGLPVPAPIIRWPEAAAPTD
ncbi:hypothetical protein [Nocardia cyriacigeorgica]|uniref:hypothetical protein n=1 Tax=Nocardia cyriacigeorgica TaxID=135487 RepID=UPI002457B8A8|nr:hypothetical protein [Nocardia cyriacigeorgica]